MLASRDTAIRVSGPILFVVDPHFNTTAPASRIDEYSQTVLKKFEFLLEHSIKNAIKVWVLTGDVFHKITQSQTYLIQVMGFFRKVKESGILVVSVTGNHDISFNTLDTLNRSPLGMMYTTGLITPFSILQGPDFIIRGFDFTEEVVPNVSTDIYTVCVAHRFYEFDLAPQESFFPKDIVDLNYSAYVLGHDHRPYPLATPNGIPVYRTGSLTRGSSHDYNLQRGIKVLVFEPNGRTYHEVDVPSEPASRIFTNAVLTQTSTPDKVLDSFVESVDSLLGFMDTATDAVKELSIYDVLDELDTTMVADPVRQRITDYLERAGIYRKHPKEAI